MSTSEKFVSGYQPVDIIGKSIYEVCEEQTAKSFCEIARHHIDFNLQNNQKINITFSVEGQTNHIQGYKV
jgi:hypothetical protein